LHQILSANPKLRGVLADLPPVVAGAALRRDGAIADRCEIVGVDLFQTVPEGADAYLMKYVVHGFKDADLLKILRNCWRVIKPYRQIAPQRAGPEAIE
jgi:hypothetical protein